MLVQVAGYKVQGELEKILKNQNVLESIHGYSRMQEIVDRAKAMLALLTSNFCQYNLGHNGVYLDTEDLAFLENYTQGL